MSWTPYWLTLSAVNSRGSHFSDLLGLDASTASEDTPPPPPKKNHVRLWSMCTLPFPDVNRNFKRAATCDIFQGRISPQYQVAQHWFHAKLAQPPGHHSVPYVALVGVDVHQTTVPGYLKQSVARPGKLSGLNPMSPDTALLGRFPREAPLECKTATNTQLGLCVVSHGSQASTYRIESPNEVVLGGFTKSSQ